MNRTLYFSGPVGLPGLQGAKGNNDLLLYCSLSSVGRASFNRSQVGETLLTWVQIPAVAYGGRKMVAAPSGKKHSYVSARIGKCSKKILFHIVMIVS